MIRGFRLLLAIAAAAATMMIPQVTASAATGDLACAVNFQLDFSPALTASNTTATLTGTAALVGCTSPNGNFSNLTAATVTAQNASVTSLSGVPCNLLLTVTGSGVIDWAPAGVPDSGFNFTINTNPFAGPVAFSGQIPSGPLTGDTVTAAPVVAHPNLDCALHGLSHLTAEVAVISLN
jgi:uncharacterized protein (DUF2141 family)